MLTEPDTQSNVDSELLYEEACRRVLPELEALPADRVVQLDLEPMVAVSAVLGVLPEVRALRAELVRRLPDFDLEEFDKLSDYAMALGHAHTVRAMAMKLPDNLRALHEEGMSLCTLLRADADALINRSLVDPAALKPLTGTASHRDLANKLQVLALLLKNSGPAIEGKCAVRLSELERALRLSARILWSIGLSEHSPVTLTAASDLRARAFTRLVEAYENTRRAITYLRWKEGDVDVIIPSLYANRGNGRRRPAEDAEAEPADEAATGDSDSDETEVTLPGIGTSETSGLPHRV